MRTLLVVVLALAAALALPAHARAGQCGLSTRQPLWIDFGTPGPLAKVFGRKGVIVAVSSGEFPAKMRATGAQTVYWDMNLNNRVGTPSAPRDADTIVARANRLFDYAAAQSGCATPLIALNELFGARTAPPWSETNAQYRANVLTFVRTLAGRGARAFLLIPSAPYTGGEAGDWWREAARYADLVPETYFHAPSLWKAGPILANRRLRTVMRRAIANYAELGIPRSKLGLVLGFQASSGAGGREGLEPAQAWYEVVKWQTLAAREVARETGIATVWSWGWASYRPSPHDIDKAVAACVYLWTRNPRLCNGPRAAGAGFDASLTEGQLVLPPGRACTFGTRGIDVRSVAAHERLTGDREIAFSALLARVAEASYAPVSTKDVLAAERAVIALRFGGSRGAYRAALARARATVGIARGVIADELRRLRVERGLRGRRPTAAEVSSFYAAYPELRVRRVEAKPAPWWLGNRPRGLALEELAPDRVFGVPLGRKAMLRALDATYAVRALGETQPLGSVPLAQARPAIAAALSVFARRAAFESWTVVRQTSALRSAICRRDNLPAPSAIRLTSYLPFLSLT